MPTSRADLAVTRSFFRQLRQLSARTGALLAAQWLALDTIEQEDVERYEEAVAGLLAAAQARTVDLSTGYVAVLGAVPADTIPPPPPVDVRPPFLRAWSQLKRGVDYADARAAGARAANTLGIDSIAAANDHTMTHVRQIVGWRRVPQGDTCRWCLTISTQRYTTARAAGAARHDGCDCRVVPIVGDSDPGQVINRPLLEALKDQPDARYLTGGGEPTEIPN